jgi:hypothetical protein
MSQERPRPAEYNLETAPGTDEGKIITVEHGHTNARFRNAPHKECQECGAAVDRREPHTTAFIRMQGDIAPQHKRPAFCDPTCWRAFATAAESE